MLPFNKIESVTVEVNGKNVKIFRDEIMHDPKLKDIITTLDKINEELIQIEYEREKLLHAKFSLNAKLHKVANEYAAPPKEDVNDEKESD